MTPSPTPASNTIVSKRFIEESWRLNREASKLILKAEDIVASIRRGDPDWCFVVGSARRTLPAATVLDGWWSETSGAADEDAACSAGVTHVFVTDTDDGVRVKITWSDGVSESETWTGVGGGLFTIFMMNRSLLVGSIDVHDLWYRWSFATGNDGHGQLGDVLDRWIDAWLADSRLPTPVLDHVGLELIDGDPR